MTASEILHIVVTVAAVQLVCDLLAHWRIYSQEPYQRSLDKLSRCQFKVAQLKAKEEQQSNSNKTNKTAATAAAATPAKTTKNANKLERNAKVVQRANDDHSNALANVAQHHTVPGVLTSLVFLILMRILGTDLKGKIVAILPYAPFSLLQRVTARGLDFGAAAASAAPPPEVGPSVSSLAQAASFTFIYMLTAASVKYYVHLLVSTAPPVGAESLMAMVDSPHGHHVMKSLGMDPADFKTE